MVHIASPPMQLQLLTEEGGGSYYLWSCFRWAFLHRRFLGPNDQLNTSSGFNLLNLLRL